MPVQPRAIAALFAGALLAGLCQHAGASDRDSPAATASARRMAASIITAANAGDLFDNVTNSSSPTVRHKASGLTCYFDSNPQSNIRIFPGLPRGDDVSCGSYAGGAVETLYATRPRRPMTLDRAFTVYRREVLAANPTAKTYDGPVAATAPGVPDLPERRTARFEYMFQGHPVFSRLSVAIVGDWIIEQRVSGPQVKAQEIDALGEDLMVVALTGLSDR